MADDILIVDDEADIRLLIQGILEDEGYSVRTAAESVTALEEIRARRPNLVVLDIWLTNSQVDGLELLRILQREHPGLPVVMISGHGTIETAVEAIKDGAYDFIEKPFKADRLLLIVQRAIEAARLRQENAELRLRGTTEDELIGRCSAIQQLRQGLLRVAPTGSRVLITGPAGAGKEVAARQLHQSSKRANGPFVVLNCATMHPERIEQELFGVEQGANGHDSVSKIGTFERAHGGTLLLDEVADMPLETQGKIVRVLQDQSFTRVGGSRSVEVDVRVIAATNRDLSDLIGEGRFREDLFYRLNVVPLHVPSLRERRDDIPALVEHFLRRSAESAGLAGRQLGHDALTALPDLRMAGQRAPAAQRHRLAADHGARRRGGADPRRTPAARRQLLGPAGLAGLGRRGDYGAAVAPGARAVRTAVSGGPGDALRRQYLAHRRLRRHGTLCPASQAAVTGHQQRRPLKPRGASP